MAWKLLLGSDIGLMSLGTIVFVFVIAFVMIGYYMKKMNEK
ncbi:MAG: DUF3149 domain-containing protein [Rhodocyclaceae bacterium]|nr:DUF3149 domain-containing protein [Rhodocyclaceae bacterium]